MSKYTAFPVSFPVPHSSISKDRQELPGIWEKHRLKNSKTKTNKQETETMPETDKNFKKSNKAVFTIWDGV